MSEDWSGVLRRLDPNVTVPCQYCKAPRVHGVRTCGKTCLIGVDPRLAPFLGVRRWALGGPVEVDE